MPICSAMASSVWPFMNSVMTCRSRSVNTTRSAIGLVEEQADDSHEGEGSYSTHGPASKTLLPSDRPWLDILDGPPVHAVKALADASSLSHPYPFAFSGLDSCSGGARSQTGGRIDEGTKEVMG